MSSELTTPTFPKPAQLPKWLRSLTPRIKVQLLARLEADGYADDPEAWFRDLVTTASMSPQGMLLRFAKLKAKPSEAGAGEVSELGLFEAAQGGRSGDA